MSTNYETNVIKFLKTKENGHYVVPLVWFGFDPCFIDAIRNSSLNNLEEELFFGTDIYIEEYLDENQNQITETHYCQTDNVNEAPDHYKVKTIIFKEPEIKGNDFVFFKENKFIISENLGVFGNESSDYPNENKLYLLDDNFQVDDNSSLKSYFDVEYITQAEELIYIQSDMTELPIAIKYSVIKYTQNNEKIIHTYIENKLISDKNE